MNSTRVDTLGDVLPTFVEPGFILYTGAGISIPPPTCAPSWWTLTEEILTAFFEKIPDDWGMPKDLIIHDPDLQPELIFENFANIFDERLYKIFKALNVGEPNANHVLIAKLAKAGVLKAAFTTNFDVYIERALAAEGVGFDLVIKNDEYDAYFERLKANGSPPRFVLFKIHGTIDRPETIVSVASAYKSAKGFSAPKAQVLDFMLAKYPVLFLGYSGWDFEHVNYRLFWDSVGARLKAIYWNRRPGEQGGPKLGEIFESCKGKFQFTESELPQGLYAAAESISQVQPSLLNVSLPGPGSEKYWNQVKAERQKYMSRWASEIPEGETLAAVITEGNNFSARFKESHKKIMTFSKKLVADLPPEEENRYKTEIDEAAEKLNKLEISREEYEAKIDKLNVDYQLAHVVLDVRERLRAILDQNRFPGVTDDNTKRLKFISKIMAIMERFDIEKAGEIAVDILKRDEEAVNKGGIEGEAGLTINTVYQALVAPDDDRWKAFYSRAVAAKEQYVAGTITREKFMAEIQASLESGKMDQFGFSIPTEKLLRQLVESVASAPNLGDFTERVEALYITVQTSLGWICSIMFKLPEYTTLQTSIANPAALHPKPPVDVAAYQAEMAGLAAQLTANKITNDEYQKKIAELSKQLQEAFAQPALPTGPVDVPREILDAFDAKVREFFGPAFKRENDFTGAEVSEAEVLLEMLVFTCWISMTRFVEVSSGTSYRTQTNEGKYPRVLGNASIVAYIKEKWAGWIEKALSSLPKRFGQRLCSMLVQFSEMSGDLALCKRVTARSLEYSEGRVVEITPAEIPLSLASWLEDSGDTTGAFPYFQLALQGLRSSFPSYYGDVTVYRTASILAGQGNKQEALRVIGKFHPAFRGPKIPFEMPARVKALDLAGKIATELGYPDAKTAIDAIMG
ncbi:MAG: SIR2 family protein [Candidatus Lokiarchaeota archaeon]|nr:SIR2 family protein [Candidatus Lokiarchaeota archaeon]